MERAISADDVRSGAEAESTPPLGLGFASKNMFGDGFRPLDQRKPSATCRGPFKGAFTGVVG